MNCLIDYFDEYIDVFDLRKKYLRGKQNIQGTKIFLEEDKCNVKEFYFDAFKQFLPLPTVYAVQEKDGAIRIFRRSEMVYSFIKILENKKVNKQELIEAELAHLESLRLHICIVRYANREFVPKINEALDLMEGK